MNLVYQAHLVIHRQGPHGIKDGLELHHITSLAKKKPDNHLGYRVRFYHKDHRDYNNSLTGSRSSRTYIGRPEPFGKVWAGSMPTAR